MAFFIHRPEWPPSTKVKLMGATYVSGMRAVAFPTTSGFAYVRFDETCESNVFPQTPHWSAHRIGTLAELCSSTALYSYCCDDGMTRGARGAHIHAETFIRREYAAFEEAGLAMGNLSLSFGKGFSDIPAEAFAPTVEHAKSMANPPGIHPAVSARGVDQMTLNLNDPTHGDLILWISTSFKEARAWQIFRHFPSNCVTAGAPDSPWVMKRSTAATLSFRRAMAKQHLAKHRLLTLSVQPEGYTGVVDRTAVVDQDGYVVSTNAIAWFCKYLADKCLETPDAGSEAFVEYRKWFKTAEAAVPIEDVTAQFRVGINLSRWVADAMAKAVGQAQPMPGSDHVVSGLAAWTAIFTLSEQMRVSVVVAEGNKAQATAELAFA